MSDTPVARNAARVIVVDDVERILLFCARGDDGAEYWFTPGGALHDGETWAAAARRELLEETGIRTDVLGPVVWRREHVFTWLGTTWRQRERFYFVQVGTTVIDTAGWEQREVDALTGHRWWPLDELATSGVSVAPADLVTHLGRLLRGEFPPEPIDVGA